MGYCAWDCGDREHTCTAWDGKGVSRITESGGGRWFYS